VGTFFASTRINRVGEKEDLLLFYSVRPSREGEVLLLYSVRPSREGGVLLLVYSNKPSRGVEFSTFPTQFRRKISSSSTRIDRVGKIEPSSSSTWTDGEGGDEASSCFARLTEYDERRLSSSYSGKPSREEEKTSHSI